MKPSRIAFVLLTALLAASAAYAEKVRVVARKANLRAEAVTTSAVVVTLERGALLEVIRTAGDWHFAEDTRSGKQGWIHQALVESANATPAPEPAPIAAAAQPPTRRRVTPARRGPGYARFKLLLNGGYAPLSVEFSEKRAFEPIFEDATEDAHFDADYKNDAGAGFDFGLQFRFARSFGVMAGITRGTRSGTTKLSGSVPHPFEFEQPRAFEGTGDGYSYKETAEHFGLFATTAKGRFDVTGFAGVSLFKVEGDLIDQVQYTYEYPYEPSDLKFTGAPPKTYEDSPEGFHVGGSLDYRIGRHFGVGLQLRYSRATAKLPQSNSNAVEVDVGGLHAALGARVVF